MKNLKVNLVSILLLTIAFTSCGDNEPIAITPPLDAVLENLNNGIMEGTLSEDYTLDPSIQYRLSGSFIIDERGTLNIPGGTTIIADAGGTEVYIAVLQGGLININGNAGSPVLMSSADGAPGDWGGLTLCGKASTTAGIGATAEVGGFVYGGSDNNDSSGIIRYLQIVGTGAQINPESQYNGISFYSVGSGTLVDNVAVINGSDDGVEFFGGTVNASNILVVNAKDDMFDFTQGYAGACTNLYGVREAGYVAVTSDPRGIEADGNLDGNSPSDINQSVFTINGVTIINNAAIELTDAIKIRRGATSIITNAYVAVGVGASFADFVDLTDSKGDANGATTITVVGNSANGLNIADNKTVTGATINATAGTSGGADKTAFAWTGYNF